MSKNEKGYWVLTLSTIVLVLIVAASIGLYRASIQADVWRREGADLSTWEVFCGAKPITRDVKLEDKR